MGNCFSDPSIQKGGKGKGKGQVLGSGPSQAQTVGGSSSAATATGAGGGGGGGAGGRTGGRVGVGGRAAQPLGGGASEMGMERERALAAAEERAKAVSTCIPHQSLSPSPSSSPPPYASSSLLSSPDPLLVIPSPISRCLAPALDSCQAIQRMKG